MRVCVSYARSNLGGCALDWMRVPLVDLGEWRKASDYVQKLDEKAK